MGKYLAIVSLSIFRRKWR